MALAVIKMYYCEYTKSGWKIARIKKLHKLYEFYWQFMKL